MVGTQEELHETTMRAAQADPLSVIAYRSRRDEAFLRQAPRRVAEETLRGQAAAVCERLAQRGRRCSWVIQHLRLARRTLSRWRRQHRHPHPVAPRGRPCKQSPRDQRQSVLEMLEREGPHLGLPTLRAEFPKMPRCELIDLQAAYRRHYQATHRRSVGRLTWHRPGRVWAMDHVHPPNPVDGIHRAVFSVRDLGSGAQLAWEPVPDQLASTTATVLASLFDAHGPPLAAKTDNGSAFISGLMGKLLKARGVAWLPSPPRKPEYNGSCEAGNHSMRTRTNHCAGAGGRWTAASLAAARRQANELNRPEGHLGPTPAQRWNARTPINPSDRAALVAALARHRKKVIAERGDDYNPNNKNHQRQVQRQAVLRALLELGLLTIDRRSITPPLMPKKRAKIS
jgi:transposase InsO family protein